MAPKVKATHASIATSGIWSPAQRDASIGVDRSTHSNLGIAL